MKTVERGAVREVMVHMNQRRVAYIPLAASSLSLPTIHSSHFGLFATSLLGTLKEPNTQRIAIRIRA